MLYIFLFEHAQVSHTQTWRNILTTLKTLTKQASEFGENAKDSMEEAGRILDKARDETGDALHAAASCVRTTARKSSKTIDNIGSSTARRLDATGSFVEDFELKDVFTGLRKFGRQHLAGSLLVAATIGFVVGSALRRVTHSCERAPADT